MKRLICLVGLSMVAMVVLVGCGGGGDGGGNAPNSNTTTANAGPDQSVVVGGVAQLDGSQSTGADGSLITYQWSMVSKPVGSAAIIISPTAVNPTFTADVAGAYVLNLVVNDGQVNSAPATVTITASVANAAPVANAGIAQSVTTGAVVTLNGSASSDANGDPLTYSWSFTSKPAGSSAALSSATAVNPTFTADVAGAYVLNLVVNDGQVNSAPATVTVTATEQAVTYRIFGMVVEAGPDSSPVGVPGVTMTLSGASSATTTTGSNGSWAFTGLDNGTYTITANKTGYTILPTNSIVTVSGGDEGGFMFNANPN